MRQMLERGRVASGPAAISFVVFKPSNSPRQLSHVLASSTATVVSRPSFSSNVPQHQVTIFGIFDLPSLR